jgi:hypothetical protein
MSARGVSNENVPIALGNEGSCRERIKLTAPWRLPGKF